uniref:MucB/RseB N-terminal domain-containing protein n=1 Tax=uncultured Armatimonadetes bacterium TaxID=157466 RepID=A0A6J4HGZ8_9BACT|nr:hypothetical protein AVDCRST_MAG63-668 [uncultured Armatimonadetes bacterium]
MIHPCYTTAAVAGLLGVALGCTPGPAAIAAQTKPAAFPAPPTVPTRIPFSDEVAGRRLLYAARDAYRAAPGLRFSAELATLTDDGKQVTRKAATEVIAAEPGARRLSLTHTETTGTGDKRLRRFVSNGSDLVATEFLSGPGRKEPERTFVRTPLSREDTLTAALEMVRREPESLAGVWLLKNDPPVQGVAWRGKQLAVNGIAADEVWETGDRDPERRDDNARERRVRTRRYLLDARTRRLLRFEEWQTAEPLSAAAARNARNRSPRRTYRRENYTNARAAVPMPATLWAQSVPSTYREVALPGGSLPETGGPKSVDPEAWRLLAKWATAQERLLSYYARIELSTRQEQAHPEARPPRGRDDGSILYTVWLRKPDRVRVTVDTTGPPERRSRSLVAVADGREVTVHDRQRGRVRKVSQRDGGGELSNRLDRAGFDDDADAVAWLLDELPDAYEAARTQGRQSLDGEPVDVLELVQTSSRENDGRVVQSTTTRTIALAADGLPRQIEQRQARSISGLFERDQPADQITTARYRQVRVDQEPPGGTFVFVPPANLPTRDRPGRRGGG